jgi:flagellar biosynthesis/type III secretory pathway M-ring protein FliF/YscJ
MANLQWWEWLLLGIGAYIAVVTLARLMRHRREELYAELTRQAAAEQERKRREEKKKKKKDAGKRAA